MSASLGEKSDKELSVLASEHNKKAFDILVERHGEYMMAISHRYTDTYHEAQDIFQKGCLKAWKAFPKFRLDCHFKTWIYRVMRSAAFDYNSWKKRKAEVSFEAYIGHYGNNGPQNQADDTKIPSAKNSLDIRKTPKSNDWGKTLFEMVVEKTEQPDKLLEIIDNNEELSKELEQVLSSLSPEHKECLVAVAEGLSYEEIAKMQKCALGTVMSRLFYARKKAQKLCKNIKNYNQNV
tara:strand:- start:10273 stop:10980 length:708 start_codon:yes stop_codon:yes gene_type:complete